MIVNEQNEVIEEYDLDLCAARGHIGRQGVPRLLGKR